MADSNSTPEYVGYPRPMSLNTARLKALAAGQGWIPVALSPCMAMNGITKHAFGGDPASLRLAIGSWIFIGFISFKLMDKWSTGLGWSRLAAIGLAALLSLSGPCWSFIGHGADWAFMGNNICCLTIFFFVLSKVRTELKRAGYVAPKGNMNVQQAALRSFIAKRQDLEAHPPVPENLFSGTGPEIAT